MNRTLILGLLALVSCRPAVQADALIDAQPDGAARLARALARVDDIDRGLPRLEDGWLWWGEHNDDGRTVHSRRGLEPGARPELVLDERDEPSIGALPGAGVEVGSLSASPDGKSVVFSADLTRTDRYRVQVKNLGSGRLQRVVDDADFSVSWSKDGSLYFTRFGDDDRPRSLWRLDPQVDAAPSLVHHLDKEERGELMVADVDGETDLFVRDDDGVAAFRVPGSVEGATRWRPNRPAVR